MERLQALYVFREKYKHYNEESMYGVITIQDLKITMKIVPDLKGKGL